jgi:RNA polymerase sigma-70 factor (ECF subfamily)
MLVLSTQSSNLSIGSTIAIESWSDEALIQWICDKRHDSRAAFSTLISRHQQWILRRCQFRLGHQHDAEDAAQDIAMRVSAKLHQFQGRARFKTWLNTIIDNYCNTYAVRRNRYATGEDMQQLLDSSQQPEAIDPNTVIAEQELVRQVLDLLPENSRQVLNLRFYNEYSLAEIAHSLSLTLSAAKARLYRAIVQLKQVYQKQEELVPSNDAATVNLI